MQVAFHAIRDQAILLHVVEPYYVRPGQLSLEELARQRDTCGKLLATSQNADLAWYMHTDQDS